MTAIFRAPKLLRRKGKKIDCPHHSWDELGRPIPPVGYCGPDCWMRPIKESQ